MSFHLVRHKNGVEVPIKVSILDAFRSAPPKRARTAPAPTTTTPVTNANNNKTKDKAEAPKATEKDEKTEDHAEHDAEGFTSEQDASIIELKAQNTSWANIATAIGKSSKSCVNARYKELQKEGKAPHTDSQTPQQQSDKAKAEKTEKEKQESQAKQVEGKGKKGGSGGGGDGDDKGKNPGGNDNGGGGGKGGKKKGKGNQANDTPAAPSSETAAMRSMRAYVAKYEKDKWLAAASRHFDSTGQRISPEMAKAMFEGKT